jgi:hypothetical protein
MKTKTISLILSMLIAISACTPTSPTNGQPIPVTESEPTVIVEPEASATIPAPTVVSEATIPTAQCDFFISLPPGMYLTNDDPHSEIYAVFLENSQDAAMNFVYVSVISPEIQNRVTAGMYQNEVYNYDPKATETLLAMEVGETISVSDFDTGFTYQRNPDTQISGYTAQAYQNDQPWEFPLGTKEIRYYISAGACIYEIGGYVDTTQSDQPWAITEELFNQIVAAIELMP